MAIKQTVLGQMCYSGCRGDVVCLTLPVCFARQNAMFCGAMHYVGSWFTDSRGVRAVCKGVNEFKYMKIR